MKKLTDKINEAKPNVDNNKILESIDTERVTQLYDIAGDISHKIGEMLAVQMTTEEMQFVINKLKSDMDEFLDNYEGETDSLIVPETGYGTEHLKQQGESLGKILTSLDELKEGRMYCIVDLGLNEWNSGYRYEGYGNLGDDNTMSYHRFKNTLDPHDLGEPDMYLTEDLDEMIENGQIAFEA